MNRITREDVADFKATIEYDRENYSEGTSFDHYQTIATKSAVYTGQGTPLGLAYVALKLNGEAGEFAEHVGKAMRDDGLIVAELQAPDEHGTKFGKVGFCQLTPERRALLVKEVGDVLWYVSAACNELGITLSEAASENLEKLRDRCERNALRGSGDTR